MILQAMSEIIQSFELFEAVHLQGKMVRKMSQKTTNKRTSPLIRVYFWGGTTGHLDLLQLQIHRSGLSRSKLLPEEWAKVVARVSLMPGCATHEGSAHAMARLAIGSHFTCSC